MSNFVDCRSDTVTKPTKEMRDAMAGLIILFIFPIFFSLFLFFILLASEVGDDVFCEDPTINQLEIRVATMFQKVFYFIFYSILLIISFSFS